MIIVLCIHFRSVYNPYDPFLATSLAQLQAAAVANAAGNHAGSPGMTDPRLQVRNYSRCWNVVSRYNIPNIIVIQYFTPINDLKQIIESCCCWTSGYTKCTYWCFWWNPCCTTRATRSSSSQHSRFVITSSSCCQSNCGVRGCTSSCVSIKILN